MGVNSVRFLQRRHEKSNILLESRACCFTCLYTHTSPSALQGKCGSVVEEFMSYWYEAVTLPDNQGTEEVEEIEWSHNFSKSATVMGLQQTSYVSMVSSSDSAPPLGINNGYQICRTKMGHAYDLICTYAANQLYDFIHKRRIGNCSVNFCYLQHLDNVDATYTSHDVREDDQAQYYHQVDFDKITLVEGFDYCQADTERSLPIMMLTDTSWLRFFSQILK
ncbi:hypothetical protein POM88_054618 [Heracleum sosnowskyi]|uniref:Uncharacterized protein n=1 Tax=Heracleum sosnowskyi TaxID=360622 RepID=A0AAD8GMW4_9APIA|nr:hypothetical protein POM88_054618 [Heracleum sosnowskyi]